MKITVDLDPELYRAVKVEAARADRSVRDVLADAIAAWLERLETEEDRASAEEALAEYHRDGGVAAAEFFERLAAETRATYGADPAGPSEQRGSEQPGSRAARSVSGAGEAGSGAADTSSGAVDKSSGAADTGSGAADTGSGASDPPADA